MNRFEVYGTLYSAPFDGLPGQGGKTTTMQYGNPSSRYKPPDLIRADPHVTREIQDILAFLVHQHGEQKGEKVRVHDILVS